MKEDINDIRDRIVSTEKVGHVTFYLVKDKEPLFSDPFQEEEGYLVYSESEQQGFRREERSFYPLPHSDAANLLRDSVQRLETILEKKRKGIPTAKQLHFLFREKIPIPLTLTWGEASDLIDERLNQIAYEREAKKQAALDKFNGYKVGDRVSWLFVATNVVENGTISLLEEVRGKKLAHIKLDSGKILFRVDISKLQKEFKIRE